MRLTRPRRGRWALLTALALGWAVPARADEPSPPDEEDDGVIVVEGVRASLESLPGATITRLEVGEDASRVIDLGDLLGASAGVHVRSAGGLGAFESLRLRGASGAELRVLVDGVPMPQGATGGLDLSSLPLDNLERIEIYRGNLPLGVGGEGLGGAVNLVTRAPDGGRSLSLAAGGGSFGTLEGSAFAQAAAGPWRLGLFGAGGRARNDFPYYDDNGTPYNTADDEPEALRQDADFTRFDASLRASRQGRHAWTLGLDGRHREGGVPGVGAVPATGASYTERNLIARARWDAPPGSLEGSLSLDGQGRLYTYEDPMGLVGLGSPSLRSTDLTGGLHGLLSAELGDRTRLSASARLDRETLDAEDLQDAPGGATRWREHAALGISGRQGWRAVVLGTQVLADLSRSGAEGRLPGTLQALSEPHGTRLLSPTASFSLRLSEDLTVRGSGGLGHRLPTFMELYGSGANVVGNPELLPEHGVQADLGLDLALSLRGGLGMLAVTAFHRSVENLIAMVQNSQLTLRAENVGEVRLLGAESEVSWSGPAGILGDLRLATVGTLLHSRVGPGDPVTEGHALPGQPRLVGRLDARLGRELLRGGLVVEADDGSFLDAANLHAIPGKVLLHARVESRPLRRGPLVTFEVRNLLDHRVQYLNSVRLIGTDEPAPQALSDWWGHPLPGRAFYISAAWTAKPAP